MNRSAAAIAALFVGLGAAGWANAQLVNGSFELPLMADPHSLLNSPSAYSTQVPVGSNMITGWTVVSPPSANLTPCCATDFDRNVNLITSDQTQKQGDSTRVQWIDLTGGRDGVTSGFFGNGIRQTFNLIAGQSYLLSFSVGSLYSANPAAHDARVQINLNGSLFERTTPGNLAPPNYVTYWQQYTIPFQALGSNTITFTALQPPGYTGGGIYTGLDDVQITVVPEPAAYLLALSGIGLVAAAVRRRRQRA